MGVFSIACYRPKPGQYAELLGALRDHIPVLKAQGLIEDRPAHVMRAADGTVVEVFEWKSDDAIAQAHTNPAVQELWQRFFASCEFVPLASLSESKQMFANFTPVDVPDVS